MDWASRLAVLLVVVSGSAVGAQTPLGHADENPRMDAAGDPLPPGAIARLGTVRWRPGGSIHHLAFAPDGKRLASWHEEQYTTAAATIWDAGSGRELSRIELPGVNILFWTWLADGRGVSIVETSDGRYVWEFSDAKTPLPHKPVRGDRVGKMAGGNVIDNEEFASFAVSPDGKFLAAGKSGDQPDKERQVVIWDLTTQRRIAGLPLGRRLGVIPKENAADEARSSRMADLPPPRRLGLAPSNCFHLAFTPDSSKLVLFCEPPEKKKEAKEHLVAVLNATTGKELRRFKTPVPLQQGSRMCCALCDDYLAIGLEDEQGTVLLWNLNKGEDKRFASGHGKSNQFSGFGVSAVAFTDDGRVLITAGRDGAVRIWDSASLQKLRTIAEAYPGWIETLAVTRDGTRLACAGQDGIVRHWNLTTGSEIGALNAPAARIWSASMTRDGATVATAAADGRLRIWNVLTGRTTRTIELPTKRLSPQVVITPEGRFLLACAGETIAVWNAATGQQVTLPELPADLKFGRADLDRDGKSLIAVHSGTVSLLDWPSGKLRRRFTLPEPLQKPGEAWCDAAVVSPDGRWLAALAHRDWYREERGMHFGFGADGVLDLWNATTGERVHRLVDSRAVGRNLLFTATGDLLCDLRGKLHPFGGGAEVELQGAFCLIDPLTGQLKTLFEPAPALGMSHRYNSAIGIAPDGRTVYCTGNDGVIHIYESATGKIRRSLTRHRGFISDVAATADGRRLLTASVDLTALVWDISLAAAPMKGTAVEEPGDLWDLLSGPDARTAGEAMAALARNSKAAVALLRSRIKRVTNAPTNAILDRLVAELGDAKFAARERAARELDQLGEAAVAGVRDRLGKLDLETHRRLARFLDKHDPTTLMPTTLREIRALEILEQINDVESRSFLEELSMGSPNARLSRAAAASLARNRGTP